LTYVILAQESGGGSITSFLFLGLMVAVFWLFIIRPQRKRAKAQQNLSEALTPGMEVRTIGGIEGVIESVDEKGVVLRVEDGKIRVTKRAIGSKLGGEED
jgi:preprotein translocase subunit YajC